MFCCRGAGELVVGLSTASGCRARGLGLKVEWVGEGGTLVTVSILNLLGGDELGTGGG